MAERRIINPWNWQDRYGFVQANEISNVNKTLICSGQTAIDAEGKAAYPDDIGAQLKMALDNLEEVLRGYLDWFSCLNDRNTPFTPLGSEVTTLWDIARNLVSIHEGIVRISESRLLV